jgi:pimeloyl-ACP methyl ester carboxylesterase
MMKSSVLGVSLLAVMIPCISAQHDISDFDWNSIEPSTSLNYTSCYGEHKCTKLLVPLDWLEPDTNPARVTLAIIARPAVVPETDPSFGGSIIVNPGGPSGSGVSFVLRAGEVIQHTADGNKKYEILSFDPRGVGFTTPTADCYRDEFARNIGSLEDRAMGPPDSGLDVLRRKLALSKGFGSLCEAGSGKDGIYGYVSTSSVVRDMVEIVDKLHELRDTSNSNSPQEQRLELRTAKELPRIQYWGFSYGTVLGNYFASMYPGRVGRMILEAVEDIYDYYNTVSDGLF